MHSPTRSQPDGLLARLVRGAGGAAARRARRTIVLWLLLIVACVLAGSLAATKTLSNSASGTGESQHALARLTIAGLVPNAVENVLVRSSDPAKTAAAVTAVEACARPLREVLAVRGLGERAVRGAQTRGSAWDHGRHVAALATSND